MIKQVVHPSIKRVSKIELTRFQLGFILEDMGFNSTELDILAYIFIYGSDSIDMVVKSGILSNPKTAENYISKFRKAGVVHGRAKKIKLHPGITPILFNIDYTIKLRLTDEQTTEDAQISNEQQSQQKEDNPT